MLAVRAAATVRLEAKSRWPTTEIAAEAVAATTKAVDACRIEVTDAEAVVDAVTALVPALPV
jgi:hypothetical protein